VIERAIQSLKDRVIGLNASMTTSHAPRRDETNNTSENG
jgi:hypothetical protein